METQTQYSRLRLLRVRADHQRRRTSDLVRWHDEIEWSGHVEENAAGQVVLGAVARTEESAGPVVPEAAAATGLELLIATLIGIFFIPAFYVLLQKLSERQWSLRRMRSRPRASDDGSGQRAPTQQ